MNLPRYCQYSEPKQSEVQGHVGFAVRSSSLLNSIRSISHLGRKRCSFASNVSSRCLFLNYSRSCSLTKGSGSLRIERPQYRIRAACAQLARRRECESGGARPRGDARSVSIFNKSQVARGKTKKDISLTFEKVRCHRSIIGGHSRTAGNFASSSVVLRSILPMRSLERSQVLKDDIGQQRPTWSSATISVFRDQ